MADLVLYDSPKCPYARRVRFVLEQLEVPYESVEVDLANVPSDYRSISPYGLVPAIVHEGNNLYESNIVNEYLDEVFHGGLMPEDPVDRARARILMDYADDHWMPTVSALKRAVRDKTSKETIRECQQDVLKRLRELETKFRGSGPYLMGPGLTLADVAFATTITELPAYGMHIPDKLMKTKRWYEALRSIAAWERVPSETPVLEERS